MLSECVYGCAFYVRLNLVCSCEAPSDPRRSLDSPVAPPLHSQQAPPRAALASQSSTRVTRPVGLASAVVRASAVSVSFPSLSPALHEPQSIRQAPYRDSADHQHPTSESHHLKHCHQILLVHRYTLLMIHTSLYCSATVPAAQVLFFLLDHRALIARDRLPSGSLMLSRMYPF